MIKKNGKLPLESVDPIACVVLAAGAGTRMNSSVPKVLHSIYGRPMLHYPLQAAGRLKPDKIVVVVGKNINLVKTAVKPPATVSFAVQKQPRGTAHALLSATARLKGFKGTVIVMNGDTPLITPGTLKRFLRLHRKHKNALSLISFTAYEPGSYGRVVRDRSGRPLRVVEDRDATKDEKAIKEVNSGVYAIETDTLRFLKTVKLNRKKGEYYLTDLVDIAVSKGADVGVYCLGDETEFLGVNTRQDISRAHKAMQKMTVETWLKKGVNFIDAGSVFIEPSVKIGGETLIYPNVLLHGDTRIGKACTIYPNVRIINSFIKDGSTIKDSTLIEGSLIGPCAEVGPFAHIRPGSRIGSAKIGNFVEVKKSTVADGTKAMHLTYLGDATIGKGVNIGAGTITCNYDGRKKHRTKIGDNVFVGSDSQFIAPVKVGKGSYIGAGSTITRDVPPSSLAISRVKQKNIKGWRKRKQ